MDFPSKGFKVSVTRTYDVYIHYTDGFVLESDDPVDIQNEIIALVVDDALNTIEKGDGVSVNSHTDTETSNGYIAFTEEFPPNVDIEYMVDNMPARLATELEDLKK